jgi:rubrerythrin
MLPFQTQCAHTCKGLCTALEIAILREKEAILQYGELRDECNYPDVKAMLNNLIIHRAESLRLLEETKAAVASKFKVLDEIREGFEM